MNSKIAAGIAVLVVLMMGAIAIGTEWEDLGFDTSDPGEPVPFMPDEDADAKDYREGNNLNAVLFEKYGAIMIIIGALMFGAMIAGVCISREEEYARAHAG